MIKPVLRGLVAVVTVALLAGCSSGAAGEPDRAREAYPGLTAPAGKGLVGAAPAELAVVAPANAPVGAQVPAIGTCIEPVVDTLTYLNSQGLGAVSDCAGEYGGVVVGVDGFAAADLAIDPTGRGDATLEGWGSRADIGSLQLLATPGCRAQFDAVADHALSMGGGVRRVWSLLPVVRMPSYDQWRSGERWVACLLLAPELVPVDGGVDVLALSADQPLPVSLQRCSTTVGSWTRCAPGAAAQQWLDLPIDAAQTPPIRGTFSAEVEDDLRGPCIRVLDRIDPDLLDAEWSQLTVSPRTDPLDLTAEGSGTVVGARCGLQNVNFGAGLEDFLR